MGVACGIVCVRVSIWHLMWNCSLSLMKFNILIQVYSYNYPVVVRFHPIPKQQHDDRVLKGYKLLGRKINNGVGSIPTRTNYTPAQVMVVKGK